MLTMTLSNRLFISARCCSLLSGNKSSLSFTRNRLTWSLSSSLSKPSSNSSHTTEAWRDLGWNSVGYPFVLFGALSNYASCFNITGFRGRHLHYSQWLQYRHLSTSIIEPKRQQPEQPKQSNRAAFQSIPIVPSILSYIERIGVGIRPKRSRFRKRKPNLNSPDGKVGGLGRTANANSQILGESEELEFFANREKQHRLHRQRVRGNLGRQTSDAMSNMHLKKNRKSGAGSKMQGVKEKEDEKKMLESERAFWLPPPPFSSFMKGNIIFC